MKSMYILLAALFLLPVTGSSQSTDPDAGECIDTDGDGWGWNKVLNQSCIPEGSTDREEPVGVRVSWPENPPEEQIEGYVLRLLVNDVVAAEERTSGTSLNFRFDAINATYSDELCVRVAAYRGTETSAFSAENCMVVPEKLLPAMTVPGLPAMVWSY